MNMMFEANQSHGIAIEGSRKSALNVARNRLVFVVMSFFAVFMVMAGRVVDLGLPEDGVTTRIVASPRIVVPEVKYARLDILDREGRVLATNLETSSLAVEPDKIVNAEVAALKLVSVLPELSKEKLQAQFSSKKSFIWLKRKLTPTQKWQVNALGIPGFKFIREEERIYPHGRLASHVLGYVDVDGKGLAGVENFLDERLVTTDNKKAVQLSLDIRVQHALADELSSAMRAHAAKGAAGLVMDVNNGEVIAMVSLPDYDPNAIENTRDDQRFNRVSQGVYELGSTFKTFTVAAALDSGVVDMNSGYDASAPIVKSRYTINDDHAKNRYLNVPEIYAFSSNIGTAKMALDMGAERQQAFLRRIGMFEPATLELAEVGAPILPPNWADIYAMTVSYGHGIAVSPLQLARGIASMVNGGRLIPATLIKKNEMWEEGAQVIAPETSRQVRQLMRMAVTVGTGGRADAIGYRVGGKTGTAEKASAGHYAKKSLLSSFVGAFPMDDPKYVVFALLDEPKGTKATHGFSSGGWTAAPVVRNVILRTAPMLGVAPQDENTKLYQQVALLIEK